MKKGTKTYKVLRHLETHKKGITSLDAIYKYNATRLSAIIFNLRHNYGYNIINVDECSKDENGNKTYYVRYVLVKE